MFFGTITAGTNFRHTAAPPTVFGTVMNYVTLRLLGMGPDEGPMPEIRGLIHKMGVWIPSYDTTIVTDVQAGRLACRAGERSGSVS